MSPSKPAGRPDGFLIRSARRLLPFALQDRLGIRQRHGLRRGQERIPRRNDQTRIEIAPGVVAMVFWKVLNNGKGPAVSVFVAGDEVLKFDCFGPGHGHFHIDVPVWGESSENRLMLPEPTAKAQVERVVFELRRNLRYYLQRHPRRRVRTVVIQQSQLNRACDEIGQTMRAFLDTVPELADLDDAAASDRHVSAV